MPIDIEYLHNNEAAAIHFVRSQEGLILNLVARAVAASYKSTNGGHLIIHRDMRNPTGTFVLSPKYKKDFERNPDYPFMRVAGLLAELFFCRCPSAQRSLRDLGEVMRIEHPFNHHHPAPAIQHVHEKFGRNFSLIAPAVQSNYYLAQRAISLDDFILEDFHVIPSCILEPFCGTSLGDRIGHYLATKPNKKRQKALDYVREHPDLMLPNIA